MYPADKIQVSVEEFLQNPTLVQSTIDDLVRLQGTIADYAFASGPANNGAVAYERVTGLADEGDREAGVVAPGAEFPIIDGQARDWLTAVVAKYAARGEITWEAKRRNALDELTRKTTQVSRKVVRRMNSEAVNVLRNDADLHTVTVSETWDTASGNQKVGDIFRAMGLVNDHPIESYEADLALINPSDKTEYLLSDAEVRDSYPRESRELNPVLSGDLTGLAGLEWISSPQVPAGEIYLMQRGISGSLNDENGGELQTDVFADKKAQVDIIHAWRDAVAVVNNPLSVVKVTGFAA